MPRSKNGFPQLLGLRAGAIFQSALYFEKLCRATLQFRISWFGGQLARQARPAVPVACKLKLCLPDRSALRGALSGDTQ